MLAPDIPVLAEGKPVELTTQSFRASMHASSCFPGSAFRVGAHPTRRAPCPGGESVVVTKPIPSDPVAAASNGLLAQRDL